jgi:hypothetical protein
MVPSVLVRKSTKEIIKHDLYPREDMLPVEGIDPDYEWLVKNIPYPEPDYDSRIFLLQTNLPDLEHLLEFGQHPSYPGLREYRITYNPIKRPNAEIVMAIENAEKDANASIWSESVHKDETLFMINSVRKEASNIALTDEEQAHLNKLSSINVKLAKNLDTRNIKVLQVTNGQEPNIDEGWERN